MSKKNLFQKKNTEDDISFHLLMNKKAKNRRNSSKKIILSLIMKQKLERRWLFGGAMRSFDSRSDS